MATKIDPTWVSAVLLSEGWQIVQPGTFRIEEYQFEGQAPVPGFGFTKIDQLTRAVQHYAGPLEHMHAVRYDIPTEIFDEDESPGAE
jgi:hypothetical protein